jgi:hypothetical protein
VARTFRSREFWREAVAEFKASGLSKADFAERKGVKLKSLLWWRWNLGREIAREGNEEVFVEVVRTDAALVDDRGTNQVRVRVGDVVVELSTLPPAQWLAELATRC